MKLSLKQARQMKSKTQRQMALGIGVSEYVYRSYERNPDRVPIGKAKEISKALGLSYDTIFFDGNSILNRDYGRTRG